MLQYYAMERFLYRLSSSSHRDNFILKGAMLLRAMNIDRSRPTMDIDLLGRSNNDYEVIKNQIREILNVVIDPDGLLFDAENIVLENITEDTEYEGTRVIIRGELSTARFRLQVDIGFGDSVYPEPMLIVLPSILDSAGVSMLGYRPESIIAEKFEAMAKLGDINSRMKDFYDIWYLSRVISFEGTQLGEAIRRTFATRNTLIPEGSLGISDSFAMLKQSQWGAFHSRLGLQAVPEQFADIINDLKELLLPITSSLILVQHFAGEWPAPGPWR